MPSLLRQYLHLLRKLRERKALERSFEKHSFHMGKRTWTRADLYSDPEALQIEKQAPRPWGVIRIGHALFHSA